MSASGDQTSYQNGTATARSTRWLGEFYTAPCAVVDNNGNHCPEPPFISVEVKKSGKVVQLCERCYFNSSNEGFKNTMAILFATTPEVKDMFGCIGRYNLNVRGK